MQIANDEGLVCATCHLALTPTQVSVSYMGSAFPVELPCCPGCGLIYVPESLASGKMLQVEQALEDK
ncbi:DVU_1557 family redox protein [Paludibacterium yongneupense]|uniref:DVU_1557 family redox protein n=1 Tax=Paludibacterium yongneupense TaxID=400061 RepID=UPI0004918ABD|nr:CLJU_RS11820 family redox protein [Paludibacterium yongneupense]